MVFAGERRRLQRDERFGVLKDKYAHCLVPRPGAESANGSRKNSKLWISAWVRMSRAIARAWTAESGYDQAAPGSSGPTPAMRLASARSSGGMSQDAFIRSVRRSYPTR
jgi:hypothetical protein